MASGRRRPEHDRHPHVAPDRDVGTRGGEDACHLGGPVGPDRPGEDTRHAATALVMSTTNRAFDPLSAELAGIETHLIGDAAAPRQAPYAFHEGRKTALML